MNPFLSLSILGFLTSINPCHLPIWIILSHKFSSTKQIPWKDLWQMLLGFFLLFPFLVLSAKFSTTFSNKALATVLLIFLICYVSEVSINLPLKIKSLLFLLLGASTCQFPIFIYVVTKIQNSKAFEESLLNLMAFTVGYFMPFFFCLLGFSSFLFPFLKKIIFLKAMNFLNHLLLFFLIFSQIQILFFKMSLIIIFFLGLSVLIFLKDKKKLVSLVLGFLLSMKNEIKIQTAHQMNSEAFKILKHHNFEKNN
jgi:cytochrome c biogenesis protein CcdA